jgi:hypothetical protein
MEGPQVCSMLLGYLLGGMSGPLSMQYIAIFSMGRDDGSLTVQIVTRWFSDSESLRIID